MVMVWQREDAKHRTRFHRTKDCWQLRKGPARGQGNPLIQVDLDDVAVRPCKTCYPDAPRIKIRKTYCTLCETKHACPHNGGVQITDRRGRKFWVWPDTNQIPLYRRTA